MNRYPAKIKLTDTADAAIVGYAMDLMLAELELHQLPPALLEFYVYAYESGKESQQPEIDHLKWDRDLWYFVANNKGKRPGDYYSHRTSELWNEATR